MAITYTVTFVNEWGQVLERDGTLFRSDSGRPYFQQKFSDLASARKFADEVVNDLPHVGCDVICEDGVVFQHFDAEWRRAKSEQIQRIYSLQRQLDRRIVSAIAGVIMLIIFGAMVHFAYGRAA